MDELQDKCGDMPIAYLDQSQDFINAWALRGCSTVGDIIDYFEWLLDSGTPGRLTSQFIRVVPITLRLLKERGCLPDNLNALLEYGDSVFNRRD